MTDRIARDKVFRGEKDDCVMREPPTFIVKIGFFLSNGLQTNMMSSKYRGY